MKKIIVSRHPAAIEFVAQALFGSEYEIMPVSGLVQQVCYHDQDSPSGETPFENGYPRQVLDEVQVIAQATAEDVRGKHVYGNVPLHLACLAGMVTVIEFEGAPPRGQEYDLAAMKAAGAVLRSYGVLPMDGDRSLTDHLALGGFTL